MTLNMRHTRKKPKEKTFFYYLMLYINNVIVDPITDCHYWKGKKDQRTDLYKLFYELFTGLKVPFKNVLHHKCLNGSGGCINPLHLKAVTSKQHYREHHGKI
jgi:hypothetical protein